MSIVLPSLKEYHTMPLSNTLTAPLEMLSGQAVEDCGYVLDYSQVCVCRRSLLKKTIHAQQAKHE